jgi:hypothetical protein
MTIAKARRVSLAEVETALRHAARSAELFSLVKDRLRPEMLDRPGEDVLRLAWEACLTVAARRGGSLPADPMLAWSQIGVELQSVIERYEDEEDRARLERSLFDEKALLDFMFNPADTAVDPVWGRGLLIRLLEERQVHDVLQRTVVGTDYRDKLLDLPAFLSNLQRDQQQIAAMTCSPVRSAAPVDYSPPALNLGSTGLAFLDQAMAGGDAAGEVYGILGAFGSGKTLLAVQAAYYKALQYQNLHRTEGQPLRHVYLFHYEAGYDEILRRVWCCAARIRADRLQNFDINNLTRMGGPLEPYEREIQAAEIARFGADNVDHEYERLLVAQRQISENLWLCDFSGPEDNPQRGTGYVQEIATVLEQERQQGREIGSVYVDYVGLSCRRHISVMSRPRSDEMRHKVGEYGDFAGRLIARPFKARVYLFHQLSSVANARSFAARQHYSDSADGKNFAENVHFCFTLGTRDREFNCIQFDCSKHRRSAGLPNPPLLYLRGDMGCFEVAADLTINPVLGRPVRMGEATAIQSGSHAPGPAVVGQTPFPGSAGAPSPFAPDDDGSSIDDFTQIED